MGCERFKWLTDGGMANVIACSRGGRKMRRPCSMPGCPWRAEALCDYPVPGERRTCDRMLCRYHRRQIGQNKDYCPEHFADLNQGA